MVEIGQTSPVSCLSDGIDRPNGAGFHLSDPSIVTRPSGMEGPVTNQVVKAQNGSNSIFGARVQKESPSRGTGYWGLLAGGQKVYGTTTRHVKPVLRLWLQVDIDLARISGNTVIWRIGRTRA